MYTSSDRINCGVLLNKLGKINKHQSDAEDCQKVGPINMAGEQGRMPNGDGTLKNVEFTY